MAKIQYYDVSSVKPGKCKVRFRVFDKLTGKELPRYRTPWKNNTATPLAKEVACRVLAGYRGEISPGIFVPYTAAFIEWGFGNTNPDFDPDNPDLEAPFLTPVYTPLEDPVFTGVKGQVKFFSALDDTNVPLGTVIQEVGLRTAPLPGYPKGILIARFQNDSPITVSSNRIRIVMEWVYIYL